MKTLCVDLVDTKTEDQNYEREDTKQGILYDCTIVQNNVPKALKSESKNEHYDVEGDVIKSEMKIERGNDSESETVVCKRISAKHDVLNTIKTAKRLEIKSGNEEHQKKNDENRIELSVKKSNGDLACNVSGVVQRKSFKKNESAKKGGKTFLCDICSKTFKNKAKLERHHRTHTGEKPFECITCKKTLSAVVKLKRHDKIHVHR